MRDFNPVLEKHSNGMSVKENNINILEDIGRNYLIKIRKKRKLRSWRKEVQAGRIHITDMNVQKCHHNYFCTTREWSFETEFLPLEKPLLLEFVIRRKSL
ncbi:unnamed protein product [Wuchereria bancrofti]|uniref:Uncharacterized protein n=1 Tax=Wuchereria bancrofti TaxID=6293 RepID=A0A3P7G8W4_WUCBA|nr:unnamed protein product [Wuchereria bancrofti]